MLNTSGMSGFLNGAVLVVGILFVFFALMKAENSFRSTGLVVVTLLGSALMGIALHKMMITDHLGKPVSFERLTEIKDRTLIMIKKINNNTALIQIEKSDPRLVKNLPEEIMGMKEGNTFKFKDVLSMTTTDGKFIAPIPMIHPH